jgi:hypothetical protein
MRVTMGGVGARGSGVACYSRPGAQHRNRPVSGSVMEAECRKQGKESKRKEKKDSRIPTPPDHQQRHLLLNDDTMQRYPPLSFRCSRRRIDRTAGLPLIVFASQV